MTILERVGVRPVVEKMWKLDVGGLEHIERRPVDSVVKIVDQMDDSQIARGIGRPRKTIRETIKKNVEINEFDRNVVYDRTLWSCLIHVADPTLWDKAWLLLYNM